MRSSATNNPHIVRRRRARRHIGKAESSKSRFGLLVALFGGAFLTVAVVVGGGLGSLAAIYFGYARTLPDPNEIVKVRQQFETTVIYDRTGQNVLYEVVDPSGDRQWVSLADIPADLINATISIEDKSFYTNPGFDVRGIARALFIAWQGGTVQGGSTITQQLVKNTLIPLEERTQLTRDRKIKEIILAAEISRLYTKDQILEWYLNTNYYGNLAYGVDAAAKVYFGKRVQDLTLGEAAMLAAIPQNPQFNPIDNWIAARQRQAIVLDYMVAQGFTSRDAAQLAATEVLVVQPTTERYGLTAPHFALYARQQAESLLTAQGLDGARLVLGSGLRIYTTLDVDLHHQVECTARAHITRIAGGDPNASPNTSAGTPCLATDFLPKPPQFAYGVARNVTNAAVVVMRPDTGEILSMVGSLDYYNIGIQGNFNAALGERQPGSAFKPFVYVTAFESSDTTYAPGTMVLDVPTTFNSAGTRYTPRNEDNQFHGPMSIREALANSYNIPTVKVISDITVGQVIRTAHLLGINTLNRPLTDYGLALALGSGEVTLTDLTYAYTVFANLGIMSGVPVQNPRPGYRAYDPVAVLRIEDRDGNVLWSLEETRGTFGRQNVLDSGLAYLINDILSDQEARLPAFGEGNALELTRPAAAKTGTTNDNIDAWTVGYTPDLTVGVWVGNNRPASMGDDVTGSTAAAPIWHAIMEYYHTMNALPPRGWERPASVLELTVCQVTGMLPTPDCPTMRELFLSGAPPTQPDIYWKRYEINARTGLRATANTPRELVTEQLFFDYPPEAQDWARQAGLPMPPRDYDIAVSAEDTNLGAITSPAGLSLVRGTVDVRGILSSAEVQSYVLEYGAGANPTNWVSIAGDPNVRGDDVLLGQWDTRDLDGFYTLRLGVILTDQSYQPFTLQVTVDNIAPTITTTSPVQNLQVSQSQGTVKLSAEADDNFEVDYVEFYVNGALLATVPETGEPFEAEWTIEAPGFHTFTMIAYDKAGNTTRAQDVQIIVN